MSSESSSLLAFTLRTLPNIDVASNREIPYTMCIGCTGKTDTQNVQLIERAETMELTRADFRKEKWGFLSPGNSLGATWAK